MKTFLWITTVVVVALALFFARSSFLAARDARAALANLADKRAEMKTRMDAMQQQLTAAQRDEGELQTALSAAETQAAAAAAAKKKAASNVRPPNPDETLALLEANPALRDLFKRSVKAGLGMKFRPYCLMAHLSPEQIEKFEEIMVQDAEDKMAFAAIVQKQGIASNDPAIPKMRAQMNDRFKASQKEVLGDAAYDQLQQLGRSEPIANFIANMSALVVDKSSMVTEAQALRLREVLTNASPTYQAGGKVEPGTIDWPRAIGEAQTFLSPPQLAAMRAQAQLPQLFTLVQKFYQQQPAPAGK
jgi:hypothetical protein